VEAMKPPAEFKHKQFEPALIAAAAGRTMPWFGLEMRRTPHRIVKCGGLHLRFSLRKRRRGY